MGVRPGDHAFSQVNEAAAEQCGFSHDELLAMTVPEIRPPEDVREPGPALDAPGAVWPGSASLWRQLRKDGSLMTVRVTARDIVFRERPARLVVAHGEERARPTAERPRRQEFLQSILDAMPGIVFVKDREGRFTLVNAAWETFSGVPRDQAVGKTASDLFPPEVAERFRRDDSQTLQTGTRTEVEETVPGAPGVQVQLTSRFPLRGRGGRIEGLVGLAVDITERKRVEERLEEYERAVEGLEEMIAVVDSDYRYLLANRAFLGSRSLARGEVVGRLAPEVLGKDLFERVVRPKLDEALAGNVVKYDLTSDDPARGPRDLAISYFPIQGPSGIDRVACVLQDVTEIKRAEEQRARLSRVVEQAAESIIVTDPAGTILYVNPSFERVSGYSSSEAIGRNPRILKSGHQDTGFYRRMWETLSRGEVWQGRLVNRRKDGTMFQEDATIGPVRDASGRLVNYVAVKRDITNEMRLERQLVQAQKMEAIGRLAGGVAHDFNNLLGVITGYGEMARSALSDDDALSGRIDQILRAAERAAGLTRQLLAFSRQQVLQPRVIDLNEVVSHVQRMLRRLIGEDVRLDTVLDPALASVKADPGQIEQVLMNLAVNARDAMPDGGSLTIQTGNVDLDADYVERRVPVRAGRYVMLAVSDTGAGMDAETRANLFEPFFTTKQQGKGTGLGLSTVYGIVKQSDGFIWCYSEVGVGTTFKVYLPRVDAKAAPAAERKLAPLTRGTETLLLLEDDPALRELLCETLAEGGYTVLVADGAAKALGISREYSGAIPLIVTDVIMPGLNGRQAAEQIQSERPEADVLFISGYTDDAIARHGVLAPGVRFLSKPFTSDALLREVAEALAAH